MLEEDRKEVAKYTSGVGINQIVVDLYPMISIIRFYAKRLNIPIKRQRLSLLNLKSFIQACVHCL